MPTIKFWNPASDTEKLAQLKTQLKAVEHELALGEDTGRDLVTQLSWEKDARKEAQKKYAGLQQEQLKLQQKHTCHVLATARAEQENAELQANVRHLEEEIPNVQLDRDTNWADCRQTIISNNKLTQEAEALKVQLAAMQEARPMMAPQQTMRSPLRSLYGSPIGSLHPALPTVSTAQAHAPAQGSLKIRLKLPVGFQQRASRLSSKPAAAPMSGKQVKGSLVQARVEGSMSLASADNAADILSPASQTKGTPAKSPSAASLPALTSRTRSSGSETSPGTPSRVDTATPAKAPGTTGSSTLQTRGQGPKKDPKKDLSLQGLRRMRTGFGIESLYAPGGMLAELDDSSSPTPLLAVSEANLQVKVKDPQVEPSRELSMPEAGSNTQLATQANVANAAGTPSSQTKSAPTKSPTAASLPVLTSRTSNSGSKTSSGTLSRVDTADEALGTTRSGSPKAANTNLQTMGEGAKKDRSLRGLRQMRTGFGIESLYAPGGMLAELANSPAPLPATAKHAGPQAAALTLAEQGSVVAEDATTTIQLSIAMAGQATGRTILPGPQSATLGECLEDWCLSRGLCQDDLTVYHFRKVVDRKVWGQTVEELAWGSEVHLQVKVQDGLTGTTQGAETHMQLPLSCCTNQAHPQAVTSVPMSGPDPAEYQGQSTAAQSANGKRLSTLLKHSPTCSSGTRDKASMPCTPLLGPSPQSALPMSKRSLPEPIAAGSALSSRSSHSMCEALPGTPTRADHMTPAKGREPHLHIFSARLVFSHIYLCWLWLPLHIFSFCYQSTAHLQKYSGAFS